MAVREEKVRIILNRADSAAIDLDGIRARGGMILNERDTLVAAEVSLDAIEDIVNNVSGIEYARLPRKFFPCGVTSEGVKRAPTIKSNCFTMPNMLSKNGRF